MVTGSGGPVPDPPGLPARLRGRLVERARWEWRPGQGGRPWAELTRFLAEFGLGWAPSQGAGPHAAVSGVVGAALLLGHDAAIVPLHGPLEGVSRARLGAAPASPVPIVPGAVVVVCEASEQPRDSGVRRTSATNAAALVDPDNWQSSWTDAEHGAAVRAVREAIGRGEVYQVNVVRHRWAAIDGDPDAIGGRMAGLAGAAYGGAVSGPGWSVLSASPECLVRVVGDRIETQPMKGTWPIRRQPRASARLLRESSKDRAEHVMIVDLERNDLARVAKTGSVEVKAFFALQAWAGLWQASSRVRAELRADVGLEEVLTAVLPGGSVTGAPKLAALQCLHDLEPVGRGPAMGGIGWLGPGKSLNLGLSIRSIALDLPLSRVHLWSGSGITWGSEAGLEVAESSAKSAPVVAALAGLPPP